MGREAVDRVDASSHRDLFAKDVYFLCAIDDAARQSATGGISHKHNARFRAPKIMLEMMAHAAARTHARTGHDGGAGTDHVKRRGLGALAREVQSGKMKRIMSIFKAFQDYASQALDMMLHDIGRR